MHDRLERGRRVGPALGVYAADLAAAVVDDPATATARYEERMWPRGATAAHGAAVGLATVGSGDEADDPRDAFVTARGSA